MSELAVGIDFKELILSLDTEWLHGMFFSKIPCIRICTDVLFGNASHENGRAESSVDAVFVGIVDVDGVCDAGLVAKSGE